MKHSARAIVLLWAWLVRVPALRSPNATALRQTAGDTFMTFQPDFTMCDDKTICRAGEIYGLDLLRGVADKAHIITESGATPVLLQIGLDGLKNHAKFSDVDLYQELSNILNLRHFRSIMVDAKSEQNSEVWSHVAKTELDHTKVQIMNGLVMGKCETANMSVFGFSGRIQEVFGVGREYTGWVTAAGTERLFGGLRGFVRNVMEDWHPAATQWRDMAALPDEELLKYVEETSYLCFTPSMLLEEAKVDAGNLAMVVIDAEGQDMNIVDDFLQMQSFKPGFLQFEARFSQSNKAVVALRKLGFRVGNMAQHNGGDSFNIFAVQPLVVAGN